jgi:hypothetical protein
LLTERRSRRPLTEELNGVEHNSKHPSAAHPGWARAVVIVIRAALIVFLLWILVSAKLPSISPVAEDASPSVGDQQSAVGDTS